MEFLVEPSADCESQLQGGPRSHASNHERSSSSSVSRASNSSPDVDSNVNVQAFNQLLKSKPAMQQYNSQSNSMAYDAHRYNFNGSNTSCSEVTPNMMLNFGGVMDHRLDHRLDPSASFHGLEELQPSNGMDAPSGTTFTEDLNSTAAYEVGEPDHGCLLQEMLQQHPHSQQAAHSQVPGAASHGDWEDSLHVLQEMVHLQQQQQQHQIYNQPQMEPPLTNPNFSSHQGSAQFNNGNAKFPGAESDLLNLLQFPRVSTPSFNYPGVRGKSPLYSTSSMSDPMNTGCYDPVLNHHFQNSSSSQRYLQKPPVDASRLPVAPILLVDLDQERDDVSVKTFGGKREHHGAGKGEPRGVNHFATERQRREFLNEKYHTLRALVPNPTKADRASIVADAIEYVKELKRTVQELQVVVEEKRRAAGDASSVKRRRSSTVDGEAYSNTCSAAPGGDVNGHLVTQTSNEGASPDGTQRWRSAWLQRTSQNGAHVDVRIVHDEVTIKVNQRRSKSCLLLCVVAVLQDLHLDLVHASGATVGEQDVFLFNTKVLEGSSTFPGYIAVKLLDALDRHLVN